MSDQRVFTFNVNEEVSRYFDESSLSNGECPRLILIMGAIAVGKTTIRRERYTHGYVVVDAAEIFLSLSRGEYFEFPDGLQEPMELIGQLVANRAIAERRHIVVELVGSDAEALKELIEAMLSVGYKVQVEMVHCDLEQAVQRNLNRGDDSISAFYSEVFQRGWLMNATRGPEK